MRPQTELLLFEASRSQLVREIIQPALESGLCVISDRFFDSPTVYQGAARNLNAEMIARLTLFAVVDCMPDLIFVVDVGAATAWSSMRSAGRKPDGMAQDASGV